MVMHQFPYPQPRLSLDGRKHVYDFRFFQTIDTESKAYWFGFLMADGGVYDNRLTLGLANRDKPHIEWFAKALSFDKPNITECRKTKSSRLIISCKAMIEDLEKHGCVKRKTYNMTFPTTIPNDLIHHFIRGYFDGDGCASLARDGRECCVSMVGLKEFIFDIRKRIGEYGTVYAKGNVVHEWRFSSKKTVQHFYDYVYRDATIWLGRKRDKIEEHFKCRLPDIVKSSRYIGVTYDKARNKWKAAASCSCKMVNLGRYPTEELAYQARLRYEQTFSS